MAIAAAGGIEHVVRAMAAYLRDENVQKAGCNVLCIVGAHSIGERRVEASSGFSKCRTLWMCLGGALSMVNATS